MQNVLSVEEITYRIKGLLEDNFTSVWVKGEIISFAESAAGHCYFNLQDKKAKIAVILFRGVAKTVPFRLENGLEVVMRARIGLYPERGIYQLTCDELHPCGAGVLQLVFEQTKKDLEAKGYFDAIHKKALPLFAKRIAIVTSMTGAAKDDILRTIEQRNSFVETTLFPVAVQGAAVAQDIVQTLYAIAKRKDNFDVIILARGGGAMEDLAVFNDRNIAQAIFESPIPVITGIGHERDFTIADFVADVRASTPTAAAQTAVILQTDLQERIDMLTTRIQYAFSSFLAQRDSDLASISHRMQRSLVQKIETLRQRNQNVLEQLRRQIDRYSKNLLWKLQDNRYQLTKNTATSFLLQRRFQYESKFFKLVANTKQKIYTKEQRLFALEKRLYLANPKLKAAQKKIVVSNIDNNQIQSIHDIIKKETLFINFIDGKAKVSVEDIYKLEGE